METKQSARELLKECREVLLRGQADEQMAMVAGIDLFLAAPSESAMEMVDKVREMHTTYIGADVFDLSDTDAAALIEGYGRRVPREMLREIWLHKYEFTNSFTLDEILGMIAKEYGVVIE